MEYEDSYDLNKIVNDCETIQIENPELIERSYEMHNDEII